jgi:hypothetical protein
MLTLVLLGVYDRYLLYHMQACEGKMGPIAAGRGACFPDPEGRVLSDW